MRKFNSSDPDDVLELEKLNAQPWQIELLTYNPSYVSWGPEEDYMQVKDGWNGAIIYDSWKSFGPWGLDELNELVNFYFSIDRNPIDCVDCNQSGYSPEAKKISDDWYDFDDTGRKWCYNITDDEVDALIESSRLNNLVHELGRKPTANEVNVWARTERPGHDSLNHCICVRQRCKRLGIELYCPTCQGSGHIYTSPTAVVALTLWMLHPRKGCSRGVLINNIDQADLPNIFKYLRDAADRNQNRFSKIPLIKEPITDNVI